MNGSEIDLNTVDLRVQLRLQVLVLELSAAFWAFDRSVRLVGKICMSFSWRYCDAAGPMRRALLTCYGEGAYIGLRIEVPASRLRLTDSARFSALSSCPREEDMKERQPRSPLSSLCSSSAFERGRIGAGDDVRITIPKLQWVGGHPFSVLAVGLCKSGEPGMGYIDLVIQRQAGITRKLSELAQEELPWSGSENRGPKGPYLQDAVRSLPKQVKVLIDGPFGRSPSLKGARHAVLVAGGIAVTFCYPLFAKAARGEYHSLETCKMVWIVRNETILDVLRADLSELVQEARRRGGSSCQLSIDIYLTAPRKEHSERSTQVGVVERKLRLPSRLRPTWQGLGSYSLLDSASSSATLAYREDAGTPGSANLSSGRSPCWRGLRHEASNEMDISKQQLPKPAYLQDGVYRHTSGSSTLFSSSSTLSAFDPSLSPISSQVNFRKPRPDFLRGPLGCEGGRLPSPSIQNFAHAQQEDAEKVLSSYHTNGDAKAHAESRVSSQCAGRRSASSMTSRLVPDLPLDPSARYFGIGAEVHDRWKADQDVLAEDRGGLVEVRRFEGRPGLAAVHGHIDMDTEVDPGRTVFATCGPAPLCDSVRAEVVKLLKKGADVALVEDCFSW